MTTSLDNISGYRYAEAGTNNSHRILLKPTFDELNAFFSEMRIPKRVFDLGCGNGSALALLAQQGYEVAGVDPSEQGVAQARANYHDLRIETGSAFEDLAQRFGRFPAVISLEVVEHVYAPRSYARTLYDILEPGGIAIVSTPYHGYIKNLTLALLGKMDAHFTALWDHGHIKFWSVRTLAALLTEAGFADLTFHRVGRIPPLAKPMIAVARKPVITESGEPSL